MIIKTFKQAEAFLALHIPKTSETTFPGEIGLERAKDFLHLLGDPQEKLKIIHVAGTSGKGSTCYLISSLLGSQGFKVGLHQSPHLIDVRERFQIGGQNISEKEFVFYLNKIAPAINHKGGSRHAPTTKLTYFEILVGLAFYIFADKKVDFAVIETGLGGWYDGTNVVERSDKLSVLTKIGLDHTAILGKTLSKIALQKAMIINENSQAISIDQEPEVEKVIKKVAKEKNSQIFFVSLLSSQRRRGSSAFCLDSRFHGNDAVFQLINKLNLPGDYQKENASLALATVNYLGRRDGFKIDKKNVGAVFQTAHFPGRFDIKKINNKTVIFDGAHNPQKMEAFISSLVKKYPGKKFNFLLAFKKGKDYKEMLKIIISRRDGACPVCTKIIITSFLTENQDMVNASEDPIVIGNQLNRSCVIIPNLKKAWETILKEDGPIVITGSLYLVGEVFRLIKNNKALKLT